MSQGLPPLVRERPDHSQRIFDCSGITPARAGKTLLLPVTVAAFKDHPRSCGKDHFPQLLTTHMLGSPPLVRERRRKKSLHLLMTRITPARAGKTWFGPFLYCPGTDHPRSCGKDFKDFDGFAFLPGSPPLVRERLRPEFYNRVCEGITPARAGKTHSRIRPSSTGWDHPRSCGKDHERQIHGMARSGSPPLVRERLVQDIVRGPNRGITPARAGKTVRAGNRLREPRDHPRSCGKDGQHHHDRNRRRGSPPLVRERQAAACAGVISNGITPARAGKT